MSLLCHLIFRAFLRVKNSWLSNQFFATSLQPFYSIGLIILYEWRIVADPDRHFCFGQGTNTRQIIRYFHEAGHKVLDRPVEISLIVCNKPGAGVLDIAVKAGIPVLLIEKRNFFAVPTTWKNSETGIFRLSCWQGFYGRYHRS